MSLITDLKKTLARLAGQGWNELFQLMEINIDAQNLREELLRPLNPVSIAALSSVAGFEDLSANAVRPVEPGHPARSILFHALASPAVIGVGVTFDGFPTVKDLDLAENVVFGLSTPLLEDILRKAGPGNFAIGVFAREYRQRRGTSHGLSADMMFSRTGISRVGTLDPHWDGVKRAFSPLEEDDDIFQFRTLPCRYGVYIAIQAKGDESDFGPYKSDRELRTQQIFGTDQSGKPDKEHDFWIPVHKLFSGGECLQGLNLDVSMNTFHVNEKLRRIHMENMGMSTNIFDSGFSAPEIDNEPFIIRTGLADMLPSVMYGEGVLGARPRPLLIEPTVLENRPIGTKVPAKGRESTLFGSFTIAADSGGARRAPEWMNVRTHLRRNDKEENLNENLNVVENVENSKVGNETPYSARHYSDFTGDGWIEAIVSGLPGRVTRRIPAYSILAAPDFYPYVSQSDLLDWSLNEVPSSIRSSLWLVPPLALSDQRSAPNLSLANIGAPFVPEDETVTAMIGMKDAATVMDSGKSSPRVDRTTYLTDGGAGFYAPGWDISVGETNGVTHLAAHGLGSPFPEDAKLCAAISAFWPAVAPDISGVYGFFGRWRIICPMTDREIGLDGAPPWDGIPGPRKINRNNRDFIEVDDFAHVDYVRQALDGRFTMSEVMKVDQATYQARILANERIFRLLEFRFGGRDYRILSFSEADSADGDLSTAESTTSSLSGVKHKFVMVRTGRVRPLQRESTDRARWLHQAEILENVTLFVDETGKVLFNSEGGPWDEDIVS